MSTTMNTKQREAFLSDLHVGVLSIARDQKGPLTVPIWYDYETGGDVWMITSASSSKGRLLKKTARISLCVQTEQAPYQYVSVEGPFTIQPVRAGQLLHMATRYLGTQGGKAYAEASQDTADSIVVRLSPATWYTVDYNLS
ncbi:MAG TPA: pyridoxamine 5'-phosphate oxidase [Gammaproteobacteria bacterium]|nr:pyridoxamine 5'-phosphate oxidase [Gammaproteobacteria bacterium]HIK71631.1 pyridoxamine 5'-phosphate oxidase [Pseudomonadales bacterium]